MKMDGAEQPATARAGAPVHRIERLAALLAAAK
jgi:hypothetical protein